MPRLNLTQGNRSKVFRKIVEFLRNDTTLKQVVTTWMVWDDSEQDACQVNSEMTPAVHLTPLPQSQSWYSEDAFYGWLVIDVQVNICSKDADDYLNFWEAFEYALYPHNDRTTQLAMQQALRDAGAETGLIEFSLPASDANFRLNNDGLWNCRAQIRVSVVRLLNP